MESCLFVLGRQNPIRALKHPRASAFTVCAVVVSELRQMCEYLLRSVFIKLKVNISFMVVGYCTKTFELGLNAAMTKDPNKPRGKTSSYAFFVATCREEHKKKHPGTSVSFAEFSKKCSERWKTMSAKEKVKFEEMAKNDKVRYDREMKTYVPPKGAKRGKKKKDPNAPKRPPSAFFVFCSDHRSRIKEENPGISIGDIAKKLGELWATQSSKDKAPYEAKAGKLKEKYEKDVAAYRAKGGSGKSDAGKKSGPGRPSAKKAEAAHDDDDDDEDEDEEDEDDDDDDDDDD